MLAEQALFGSSTSRAEAKAFLDRKAQVIWASMLKHPTGIQLWDRDHFILYQQEIEELLGKNSELLTNKATKTIEANVIKVCELLISNYSSFNKYSLTELKDALWSNYKFQNLQLSDIKVLGEYLQLNPAQMEALADYAQIYHMSINPHYLSLIDTEDSNDPIRQIFLPYDRDIPTDLTELTIDPSGESEASNIGEHTRQRYPLEEVAYVNMPGVCPAGCGYCQRARGVLDPEIQAKSKNPGVQREFEVFTPARSADDIDAIVEEVAERKYLTDLLLSGGDALMLPHTRLLELLRKLFMLPAFKRGGTIRLGTKIPVVNPWRCLDPQLLSGIAEITENFPNQLYIVTHVVHPREVTPPLRQAVKALKKAGIARVLNQGVLLKGINDQVDQKFGFPGVLGSMLLAVAQSGIQNYYVFLAKEAAFSDPFRTGVGRALEIARLLQNQLPGPYLPQDFVISAPHNGGKIRIAPNWIDRVENSYAVLKTVEGMEYRYPN